MLFSLFYNDKITGEVHISSDDFHHIFNVTSSIVDLNISRVFLKTPTEKIPLGILMPKNNTYTLLKKIPKSYLKNVDFSDKLSFFIEVSGSTPKSEPSLLDPLLKSSLCENISKKEFFDYDIYYFELNSIFYFDFCFTFCFLSFENDKPFICVKTSKQGKIIV